MIFPVRRGIRSVALAGLQLRRFAQSTYAFRCGFMDSIVSFVHAE